MRWALLIALVCAVLGSAVAVIVLKHEARTLFTGLQQAAQARDAEQSEWSRLQLEQAWLGEAGRIERHAVEQLEMKEPEQPRVLVRRP